MSITVKKSISYPPEFVGLSSCIVFKMLTSQHLSPGGKKAWRLQLLTFIQDYQRRTKKPVARVNAALQTTKALSSEFIGDFAYIGFKQAKYVGSPAARTWVQECQGLTDFNAAITLALATIDTENYTNKDAHPRVKVAPVNITPPPITPAAVKRQPPQAPPQIKQPRAKKKAKVAPKPVKLSLYDWAIKHRLPIPEYIPTANLIRLANGFPVEYRDIPASADVWEISMVANRVRGISARSITICVRTYGQDPFFTSDLTKDPFSDQQVTTKYFPGNKGMDTTSPHNVHIGIMGDMVIYALNLPEHITLKVTTKSIASFPELIRNQPYGGVVGSISYTPLTVKRAS